MKRDLFGHARNWEAWKEQLTPDYIEEGLTQQNSKLFLDYLLDLEKGANIPKTARKGARNPMTLNRLRSKVFSLFKKLQLIGIDDISKAEEKEIVEFFANWRKEGHSADYSKRFKAFWHWWVTKNRRQGVLIPDITEDIDTTEARSSDFVWITKKELDEVIKYLTEEEQLVILFAFDSIIRSPTELLSLKVENIYSKNNEVWLNIPDSIAKTFGRTFNLLYCGEEIEKYIKKNKLKDGDYLFDFNYQGLNKKLQQICKKIFDNKKSQAGEYFKKITLYDLRHSGSIHYRQLFQKTGQSLDSLRHRGGWTDMKMINYYTKLLGLDGHIDKNKTLLQEDKTKLEKELDVLKRNQKGLVDFMLKIVRATGKKDPSLVIDKEGNLVNEDGDIFLAVPRG